MIALTSISPKHINGNIQQIAIDSWNKLGFKVYSLNCLEEIETLSKIYKGVEFIESRDLRETQSKPYIPIQSFVDFAKTLDDNNICLINSDIILNDSNKVLSKIIDRLPREATIVKRRDFVNDINNNREFKWGIDVFFIHKNYIDKIKCGELAMGLCWWDYSVPYSLLREQIKVHLLKEPFAYHRYHNVQYSHESWKELAVHFCKLHGYKHRNAIQVNRDIYEYIMENTTKIDL